MFRHASSKELYCLLLTVDPTFTKDDIKEVGITTDAEAGRYLSNRLQSCFETTATQEALRCIKEDDVIRTELNHMYTQTIDAEHTPQLRDLAQSFGEGVVNVFLRDIVHMLHGPRADLLEGVTGMRVLLAGLVLGTLYREAEPPQQGVQLLVLKVLRRISDCSTWLQALQRYGPAPPRIPREDVVVEDRAKKRKRRPRAKTVAASTSCSPGVRASTPPSPLVECLARRPRASGGILAKSTTPNRSPHQHAVPGCSSSPTRSVFVSPRGSSSPLRPSFDVHTDPGSSARHKRSSLATATPEDAPPRSRSAMRRRRTDPAFPGMAGYDKAQGRGRARTVSTDIVEGRESSAKRDSDSVRAASVGRRSQHMVTEDIETQESTGVFATLQGEVRIVYPESTEAQASAATATGDELPWLVPTSMATTTQRRGSCCF